LTAGTKTVVHLSARNLPGVLVRPWGEASAYDVLWSDLVLVESSAFDAAPVTEPAVETAVEDTAEEAAAEVTAEDTAEVTADEPGEAEAEDSDEEGAE